MKNLLNNLLFNSRFIFQDAPAPQPEAEDNIIRMPEMHVEGEVPETEEEAEETAEADVKKVESEAKRRKEELKRIIEEKYGDFFQSIRDTAEEMGYSGEKEANTAEPAQPEKEKPAETQAKAAEAAEAILTEEKIAEYQNKVEDAIAMLNNTDNHTPRYINNLNFTSGSRLGLTPEQSIAVMGNAEVSDLTEHIMKGLENLIAENDAEGLEDYTRMVATLSRRLAREAKLAYEQSETAYGYKYAQRAEETGEKLLRYAIQRSVPNPHEKKS